MPGLASADPHTLSTLSISRTNGQARSNGLLSPSRTMDHGHTSEQSQVDNRTSLHQKELQPRFDARAADESLSLYCKPIELYNIIRTRSSKKPIFLQRCLRYKIDEAKQRRIKLTVSAIKVAIATCDTHLNTGKNQKGFTYDEHAFESVLVMLTAPVLSAVGGNSCFRLSQTHVLRTKAVAPCNTAEHSSVTFLLPEMKKLLLLSGRDDAVFVFITSAEISPSYNGNHTKIKPAVNSSRSVLWGSISLRSLCQKWSASYADERDVYGSMHGISDETIDVELLPSRLQLVNSVDGRYVNFQQVAPDFRAQSMVKLQLCLSVQGSSPSSGVKLENGNYSNNSRAFNEPSLSRVSRSQPGQVVFHYYYYYNQLYKSEGKLFCLYHLTVTENYSCPFCVQCCSSFKGLRYHLNSNHDLFTFEILETSDHRLVNVFCRNDVLDPEGNVRDIDGLSDPRLKNFFYWSRCGPLRRSNRSIDLRASIHQYEQQSHTKDEEHHPVMVSQPNDLSSSVSADKAETPAAVQEYEEKREKKKDEETVIEILDDALEVTKKPRVETDESKTVNSVGHKFPGIAPNSVCLAIAAPRPTDKHNTECKSNAKVLPLAKSRVNKHRKSLVERCEARARFQLQKRQFYHSHTAQPMALEQLLSDRDSEDENDDTIMDLEDIRMLDDFVDVTQDEKELMHLWNSFVRRQRVLADGHCPWACEAFTKLHAKRFNNSIALRRCLLLFLIKLWNHNLIDGNIVNRCLLIVDSFNEINGNQREECNQTV
ncbi:hypothetical protein KP509_35G053800 [Ceratopteris richardii]|uniref:Polycomb protein VEFS-Box domain-containing protein n=1 Tax=Ceratopteris richardii TaxID=49495 RepID=A0A8T2QGB2_CERRI|nr:hypothetical protein KP509_35G053800 [Ceratopteris richardii]